MDQRHFEVNHVSKKFKGIYALKDVSIVFQPGEIHALLGENGAGKSTLCKILSGAITPDTGEVLIDNEVVNSFTPNSAREHGICMIYQEFNLVPEMTVWENIFLGKEIRRGLNVDKKAMISQTNEIFKRLKVTIDPTAKIKTLSVAYCQIVEIAKALRENVKYMIMDEPTAPLTYHEVDALMTLVRDLKAAGVTIIYISHRIEELLSISDRITILRDGEVIRTVETCKTNRPELIKMMVGREMGMDFPPKQTRLTGKTVLRVEHLNTPKIHDISFELHQGEILGLGGLVGAGRTEIVRALFGADEITSGKIFINGKEVAISNPKHAIGYRIGLIPEDRKNQGLHLQLPIGLNISLIKIRDICKPGITVRAKKENEVINKFVQDLSIKTSSISNSASSLSGGNQQKVVLAKWLSTDADILFFDEPTRGIDVGAKKEIYYLLNRLRQENKAIVMISSEMIEMVGMCDRVIVLHEGGYEGELVGDNITQENILELASGRSDGEGVISNE